jgi:hypothetical protein
MEISELPDKVARLALAAQGIADETIGFFEIKGPGVGDHASLRFMAALRHVARELFGDACKAEHRVCKGVNFAVDFYFPEETVVVEIALGLDKPISEYERDIFKCLLAQHHGCPVKKLLFITKPGALKKNSAPGPLAIQAFVKDKFELEVEILGLHPAAEGKLLE